MLARTRYVSTRSATSQASAEPSMSVLFRFWAGQFRSREDAARRARRHHHRSISLVAAFACEKIHELTLPHFFPLTSFASVRDGNPLTRFMQSTTEIGYNSKIEGDVIVTRVDAALNWFRKNSL